MPTLKIDRRLQVSQRQQLLRKIIYNTSIVFALAGIGFMCFQLSRPEKSTAAVVHDYRLSASGCWNNAGIWEFFMNGQWVTATTAPSSFDGRITISAGRAVSITEDIVIDQVVIEKGGQLILSAGTTTLANSAGDDLVVNGKLTINSDLIQNASSTIIINGLAELENRGSHALAFANAYTVVNSGGRYRRDGGSLTTAANHWTVNSGGVYQHNMDGGDLPVAMWSNYSTCEITGPVVRPLGNMGQTFYNLSCNCPEQAARQGSGNGMAFVVKDKKRMTQ